VVHLSGQSLDGGEALERQRDCVVHQVVIIIEHHDDVALRHADPPVQARRLAQIVSLRSRLNRPAVGSAPPAISPARISAESSGERSSTKNDLVGRAGLADDALEHRRQVGRVPVAGHDNGERARAEPGLGRLRPIDPGKEAPDPPL